MAEGILIGAGLLLVALAIPLILRKVPRNNLYGLRTPQTLQGSEEEWYRANRRAGIALGIAGAMTAVVGSVALLVAQRSFAAIVVTSAVLPAAVVAALLWSVRRGAGRT